MKLSIKTPLILSQPLSARLGLPVWLKLEALQPSGSFKNRGIGELCTYYAHQKARCFVSFSGGNAGLAVAYAGRQLGTAVKVIVPPTSSQLVCDKMRQEGAEVIVHWDNWHFAEQDAKKLAEQEKGVYVHPFDHPLIWQGHSKIIDEIVEEGIRPGAVALSVGGGGLLCGILEGLHRSGLTSTPVFTAETEGAASFYMSVQEKRLITLDKIDSVATTLGAKRICEQAYQWVQKHPIFPQLVTDRQAVQASLQLADDHRLLVEPACGASLALAYDKLEALKAFSSLVIIVCGGSGVSRSLLAAWSRQFNLNNDL